ncbi:hypothetical protein OBP_050 [Pseudomonas phage OBP]|uniref:hypothetical protein n=1 Tax=Pseudomonas phage OBP TaxID=1124849 RepID=UPI000240D62F|nr:hypothetical protein OBP_050 [Pseudomonas phage OBP]AEV89487.1 hypothetical protein OBP_050 [Pseudomonas phage OBP]
MNLKQLSIGRELINFVSFDSHIIEAVNEKAMFAHRLVRQEDIPSIVDGLREWLIRSVGIFTTVGYYRSPDLKLWFDGETIIEEFDELLLKFKTFLEAERGIDLKGEYSLLRYRDNLNFIMFAGKPIGDVTNDLGMPVFSGFLTEEEEIRFGYALEEANHFIEDLISRMNDKFDALDNAEAFVKELIGDRLPEVLKRHLSQ